MPLAADTMHASGPDTSGRPRILCLHGGGVSAQIFRLQARKLVEVLSPYFRLVFADGPFSSNIHPDLVPVYSEMEPCYSWAGRLPKHCQDEDMENLKLVEKVRKNLLFAMASDPGTGNWTGLLGFSQGARLALSILLEDQRRRQDGFKQFSSETFLRAEWKFGILLAGRGPPYALSNQTQHLPHCENLSVPVNTTSVEAAALSLSWDGPEEQHVLTTPTLHVHGLSDEGIGFHRLLLKYYVATDSARLVNWNGGHRIPIRTNDVNNVCSSILEIYRDTT